MVVLVFCVLEKKICKLWFDFCIGRLDGLMMVCSLISKDNL